MEDEEDIYDSNPQPAPAPMVRKLTRHSFFIKGDHKLTSLKEGKRTRVIDHNTTIRTEDHLDPEHLERLMIAFQQHGGELNIDQFTTLLKDIVGESDRYERQMQLLFVKMDTNQNGLVDWDEFCSYMMRDLEDKTKMSNERDVPLLVSPQLLDSPHRGIIRKIQLLSNPARVMTVSEEGIVCFWNMKFTLTRTTVLNNGKAAKSWRVVDAMLMPNAFRIAVATTNRDITFFDLSTGHVSNRLTGLTEIVTSMDYHCDAKNLDRGTLVYGDMGGCVSVLQFFSASTQLFNDPLSPWDDSITVQLRTITETSNAAKSVVTFLKHKVHGNESVDDADRSVRLVRILPTLGMFLSCANSQEKSFVLRDLDKGTTGTDFSVPRGVSTFDYSVKLNLIATGGLDSHLRIWNPYVHTQPISTLKGHATAIAHVIFNSSNSQVISISTNEVIKIWDLKDHVCLNTLTGAIPHHPLTTKHTITSCGWHEPSQMLLTSTREEFCAIELVRDDVKATRTTHDSPVIALEFNPTHNLVLTGDSGGSVCLWDASSGEKKLTIADAHGTNGLTLATFSAHESRFITTAPDGSVCVWSVLSGQLLQRLERKDARETIGVVSTRNAMYTINADRNISCYDDKVTIKIGNIPYIMQPEPEWALSDMPHDEFSASAFCADNLLATGCYDGHIYIWGIRLGKLITKLDVRAARKAADGSTVKLNVPAALGRFAVDQMIWLKARLTAGINNSATLVVSAENGNVFFWNALKSQLLGGFHAGHTELGSETVPAIAVSTDNKILYTGDSLGYLKIWDISDYYPGGECHRDRPRLVSAWRAHVQPITCLTVVERHCVILSGSADCSVRIWTMDGQYIETFGQGHSWVLASEPTGSSIRLNIPQRNSLTESSNVDTEIQQDAFDYAAVSTTKEEEAGKTETNKTTTSTATAPKPTDAQSASSPLGKAYQQRCVEKQASKATWRKQAARTEADRATKQGFSFCQPYQALPYTDLSDLSPLREPSASFRARTQRAALWDEPDDETAATKPKQLQRVGKPVLPGIPVSPQRIRTDAK